MKKLLKHCILLTGIICLLSGCSGTDGTSDASEGNGQSTDTAAVNTQTASDLDVSPEDYEGKDYHFDTDYQSFFFMPNIAKGEAGYYYWEENDERLYYYDTATAQSVVLCNKADCTHDDDTCNAYFNAAKKENQDVFCKTYIQYYDGAVYVTGYDPKGNVNLYRVAADGSSCDKYMCLFKQNMMSPYGNSQIIDFTYPEVCIHRGYVYFINNMETTPKIYRMKMGSETSEVIYENTGLRPAVYRIKPYGDQIYFQAGNFEDDTYIDIEGGVYAYDPDTEKVSLYKESAISPYLFYKDDLYYSASDGIYHYDKEEEQDEKVLDTEKNNADFMMINDQIVVYLDEDSNMFVCDLETDSTHTIDGDGITTCLFGDGHFMFAEGYKEGDASGLYAIKFSDLLRASEWTNITDMSNGN